MKNEYTYRVFQDNAGWYHVAVMDGDQCVYYAVDSDSTFIYDIVCDLQDGGVPSVWEGGCSDPAARLAEMEELVARRNGSAWEYDPGHWQNCMPVPNRKYRTVVGGEYRCLADFQCFDTIRRLFGDGVKLGKFDGVLEDMESRLLFVARNMEVNDSREVRWGATDFPRYRRPGEPTYGADLEGNHADIQ